MRTAEVVATSPSLSNDTYIYKILPIDSKSKLGSISSDDSLRVIDPKTLQWQPSGSLGRVHDGITCLKAFRDRGLVTAGTDGLVKGTDLRSTKITFELSQGP